MIRKIKAKKIKVVQRLMKKKKKKPKRTLENS
jgi:hypothetical protein